MGDEQPNPMKAITAMFQTIQGEATGQVCFTKAPWPGDYYKSLDFVGDEEDRQEEPCQETPYHICFSGRDQGAEAYLRWEKDMEEWFQQNHVPREEMTTIAEETLIEEAYLKWDEDAYFRLNCELPDRTWEEMKQLLHKTFVEEIETNPYYSRCQIPQEPRRLIMVTPPKKSFGTLQKRPAAPHQGFDTGLEKLDKDQKVHILIRLAEANNVRISITRSLLTISMADIMHFFLPSGLYAGTSSGRGCKAREFVRSRKDTDLLKPPEDNMLKLRAPSKEASPQEVNKTEVIKWVKAAKQRSHVPDQNRGVILSYILKGEPPDAPCIIRPHTPQGKTLSSQKRMKANLLSLGAGDIVSRSKPFQEGEYDEVIKTSSAEDHGIKRHDAERMKLRRAKETCEWSSARMEAKIKHSDSTNTWRLDSTHIEFTTKKNQPKRSPDEEDIEDTTWKFFNELDGDIRPLTGSFQTNQDEPVNEFNCSGFLTHQWHAGSWIRFNPSSYEGDNQDQSGVNRFIFDLDIKAVIGEFPSNQVEIGYKPNCYEFLIHQRTGRNWIHINLGSHEKDIQFQSQRILDLPYLEPSEFGRLQTYLWRPGGISKGSRASEKDLEASTKALQCSSTQRIRRILLLLNLPYPDAFIFGGVTTQQLFDSGQRLYLCCCCVLEGLLIILDVPRHHTFTPKLSRLKNHHNLLIWPIFSSSLQRLYFHSLLRFVYLLPLC